jgi:RNA polymerase sigma factor (TIGR02999 family)
MIDAEYDHRKPGVSSRTNPRLARAPSRSASSIIDIRARWFILSPVSEVTRILDRVQRGEGKAAAELLPLVYGELRKLAAWKMAHEAPGQTLQPTALVHEAWLRLVGPPAQQWNSRGHFFAAAAEAMRRILIDVARRKQQVRHGGGLERVDLDGTTIALPDDSERLLEIHEVLDELAALDPLKAEVVKLRFFVGFTHAEIAQVLNLSERTVERTWRFAKAWLVAAIQDRANEGGRPGPSQSSGAGPARASLD